MGDVASIKIEGLGQLTRDLRKAGDDLSELKDVNQEVSGIVLHASHPPRGKTGKLAASGRTNRAAKKVNVLYGSARVPYAAAIHWGYRKGNIRSNPFVTEAAERTQPLWLRAYEAGIQQILNRIAGK